MTGRGGRTKADGGKTARRSDGRTEGAEEKVSPVRGSESTVESTKREMKGSTMAGAGGRGECFGELHQNNDGSAWGGLEDS